MSTQNELMRVLTENLV
jgi:hypothetical protein